MRQKFCLGIKKCHPCYLPILKTCFGLVHQEESTNKHLVLELFVLLSQKIPKNAFTMIQHAWYLAIAMSNILARCMRSE